MAQIRTYDKQGNVLAQATSPVANGGLCWVGTDQFLGIAPTRINQFSFDGQSGSAERTVVLGGAGLGFASAEISRRQVFDNAADSPFEPDGHHMFVSLRVTEGETFRHRLRVYDFEKGTLIWNKEFATILNSVSSGGITTNGMNWYTGYTDNLGTRLISFEADGASASEIIRYSPNTLARDMCHDGMYLWTLEGSTVKQYDQNAANPLRAVNSFAASGATHQGLTTDGNNLFVLSRT